MRSARQMACLVVLGLLSQVSAWAATPASKTADWQYQLLPEKTQASYDLRFRVAPKGAAEGLAVRLFVGDEGRNGAFFELGPRGVLHGAVRDGEEVRSRIYEAVAFQTLLGQEFVFEQRPHRWGLCADGRLLAGGDDFFGERRSIGFGVIGGDAEIADLRFQAVPDVFFTDTFMRTGNDPTSWTELGGKWTLKTVSNPLLSANAFTYIASGAADPQVAANVVVAEAGFSVTLHARSGALELPMLYSGPEDYALFRWTAPAQTENARQQWVRVQNGKETILGESPGGYTPDQNYALAVNSSPEGVTLSIDGVNVFKIAPSSLPTAPLAPRLTGASVVGEWFWSDIRYSVAARPAKRGAVGVYLCYRSPKDFYLFRWTSRDSQHPIRQLIRQQDERATILAESVGGYLPEQWYTLTSTVGSGWAEVAIDDQPVLRVHDTGLSYGKVGLYVEGDQPASFDDVAVENHRAVLMDFTKARPGSYLVTGGDWMQVAPDSDREFWPGGMAVQAAEPARLLFGNARWRNYALSARLGAWDRGAMGLCLRYQDELNYYLARVRKDGPAVVELVRACDGREEVLRSAPVSADGMGHRLSVSTEGDAMVVALDGMPALRAADNAFLSGRAGLYAQGVDGGTFSDVTCEFLPPAKPIQADQGAFASEFESGGTYTMQIWSGALSDWTPVVGPAVDDEKLQVETWWRRSDFHGDVRLDLRLDEPPAAKLDSGRAQIGIVLHGNGKDLREGLVACLSRDAGTSGGTFDAVLFADGAVAARGVVKWEAGPRVIGLVRAGDLVSLCVGGEAVLTCRDPGRTSGQRIGWFSGNVQNSGVARIDAEPSLKPTERPILRAAAAAACVDIYSDTFCDYNFNAAPTDWREAGGTWEISNKWQCDPRWSFFSGRSDKLAALWNKRPVRGDFTIEFYVGNKMDRERGNAYQYAQDMNITVCADGNDLASGYSFLLGGFDNTFTGIYRGMQRWGVPATPVLIDRSSRLHHRWYHIAVSRKGNTFDMRVDDAPIVSMTDPQPLGGTQWAIWTYNNGIMCARVRITADAIGERESPDLTHPATVKTVYSN